MNFNKKERDYALFQLALRAGISGSISEGDPWQNAPVEIVYTEHARIAKHLDNCKKIIICAANDDVFDQLIHAPENSLDWSSRENLLPRNVAIPISARIPILFPAKNETPAQKGIEVRGNTIIIYFDIAAAAFFMLTRYEEYRASARDRYGRFPAKESAAFRQSFLLQPIVDEYAMILRAWIQYLAPAWKPHSHKGKVTLTHDIDFIRTLPNLRKAARMVIKENETSSLLNAVNTVWQRWKSEKRDPASSIYVQAIENLCALSHKNNLEGKFFFKASPSGFFDSGYDINQRSLISVFKIIKENGFSIGLHPGFFTMKNTGLIAKEKKALETAIGMRVSECRQHYLRFQVPQTWRNQIAAGLGVDNSLGFAEHAGFRCGTCHPYQPFDIASQKKLDIIERPLIVMDSTLKDYMNLSMDHAEKMIINLASQCLNMGGEFTLLWHNTSFFNQWEEWGNLYESILPTLSAIGSKK